MASQDEKRSRLYIRCLALNGLVMTRRAYAWNIQFRAEAFDNEYIDGYRLYIRLYIY